MKKIIFSLVLLVGFALSTMTVQSSFAQDGGGTPLTHADNEGGGGSNETTYSCTVSQQCWKNISSDPFSANWIKDGTVQCSVNNSKTRPDCQRGFNFVKCDGYVTSCY